MNSLKNLFLEEIEYKNILEYLKKEVDNLWLIPLHQFYTNHGLAHSEKVVKIVDNLLNHLEDKLNEVEKFILLASIYLHDIGMQSPVHAGLPKKRDYSEDELKLIRNVHNDTTAKMIFESYRPQSELDFGLKSLHSLIVECIAEVSKHHRKYNIYELKERLLGLERLRLPLLASLLRLGDELDVDYQRVNLEILRIRDISVEEKFHWWSHHYLVGVDITQDGYIFLSFNFPKGYKESQIPDPLINKSKLSIEKTLSELSEVFKKYKLKVNTQVKYDINYSEIEIECPDDLVQYLVQNFNIKLNDEQSFERSKAFIYYFLPHGSIVSTQSEDEKKRIKRNRIFLDVGNGLEIGLIDPHILRRGFEGFKSTAGFLINNPDLILQNIDSDSETVEIVTHIEPDFDCFSSVYLTQELILNSKLPDNYEALVDYTEKADMGDILIDRGHFCNPYFISRAIHPLLKNKYLDYDEYTINLLTLNRGVYLIKYVMKRLQTISYNKSLWNYSIFEQGHPFQEEYEFIKDDFSKYKTDLSDEFFTEDGRLCKVAEKIEIELPSVKNLNEKVKVPGLIWNRIPTCILHKDWARADDTAPNGNGYIFTFIPISSTLKEISENQVIRLNRVVISVKSDSGVCLRGLGEALEEAEIEKEKKLFGDVNNWRSRKVVRKTIDYADNEDPWYDGLGHNYTIVDSPGRFSLLSIEEIKQKLFEYTKVKVLIDD